VGADSGAGVVDMKIRCEVRFSVDIPCEATYEEIEEWLRFELHERAKMKVSNPLSDFEMAANYGSVNIRLD
jgi:hypothetical protein